MIMQLQQMQVRKEGLSPTRIVAQDMPDLGEGEILVKIDRFALTANNVTYGVVGERIGYWNFFPALDNEDGGWGIIPVWGFADVIDSRCEDVPVGDRLYGYFPMGSHLVIQPAKVSEKRLMDGAAHRSELHPVYNNYARVRSEPAYDPGTDNDRMLLYPLYATSFCIDDFLVDNDWFGATQIVVASASSKTGIGLAYALGEHDDGRSSVGLTSPQNADLVTSLGLYDSVVTYDAIASIDASKPTVIVDMSGSGDVLAALHTHLGDNMRFCSNVGVTRWTDARPGAGFIKERSAMFFAPGQIQKRGKDWGPGVFEKKAHAFWQSASEKSHAWLKIETTAGLDQTESLFAKLRDGGIAPQSGLIVEI